MTPDRFLDTNILLYSISLAPDEQRKRDIAIELLDRDDIGLSAQVLSEFYFQATRPTRRDSLPPELAAGLVGTWRRFPIQAISADIVTEAMRLHAQHGFSFWDSQILSAAMALGCKYLVTEDMSHGREIEGIRIVDPFK